MSCCLDFGSSHVALKLCAGHIGTRYGKSNGVSLGPPLMGTAGQERRRAAGFLVLREYICCCGNQASYCCCFEDDHAGVHCNAELAAKDASLRDGFTQGSPSPTLSCRGWVNQRMMAAKHLSYSVQTRGREEGREGMCATVRSREIQRQNACIRFT